MNPEASPVALPVTEAAETAVAALLSADGPGVGR
jgi:hypothetical protein